MWIPLDHDRFTAKFKHHEVAVFSNDRVYRLQDNGEPVFVEGEYTDILRDKYKNTGLYLSVFARDEPNVEDSAILSSLYFDFDSEDLNKSLEETLTVYNFLNGMTKDKYGVKAFFSGGKGFHIECEPLAFGISPSENLPQLYRYIASDLKDGFKLETLDMQVYDSRRMWRLVNSRHQKTGLYKVFLSDSTLNSGLDSILKYAERERPMRDDEPKFSLEANEWFSEYVYRMEAEEKNRGSETMESLINRFESGGTSSVKAFDDSKREFNPLAFMEDQEGDHCSSLARLWNKAEKDKHLDHEERLFLCSLLTYNDEARYYLHSILSNLSDYSWEKSESHIQDWIKRREYGIGGRPYSCRRANEAGIGCLNCDLEPRQKYIKTVNGKSVETGEIADPSPIRFVYSWKKDKK